MIKKQTSRFWKGFTRLKRFLSPGPPLKIIQQACYCFYPAPLFGHP